MKSFRASSNIYAERGEELRLILNERKRNIRDLNITIRELGKLRDKDKQRF